MTNPLTIFIIHPSDLLTDFEPYGDGLIAHEWIRLLAEAGHRIHVAASRTALRSEFPSNVIIHRIDIPTSARHLERLDYALKVRRLFREISSREHIDVAHQLNPVVTGLSLALFGLRVPVVLGTYFPRWPLLYRLTPKARFLILSKGIISFVQQRLATKLLLSTSAATQAMPFAKGLKRKFIMLPHAVDDVSFIPSQRPENSTPTILYLANIMQRKGVFTLLDAFVQVHRVMPEAELVYAGGGFDYDQLRERVKTLPDDLQKRIRFTGNVSRADVPGIMADCSVYCLPSHGEPYGMSALEAMASGKPIVVTNVGGLAHLVPAAGGIHVPPHEVQPLANALVRILQSPRLQIEMGRANRQVVEELHSPARAVARLEATYRSVAIPAKRGFAGLQEVNSKGLHGRT